MTSAIVFDVSTIANRAEVRPTGIDRVQLEMSIAVAELASADVTFCTYDRIRRIYERTETQRLYGIASTMRGGSVKGGVSVLIEGSERRDSVSHRSIDRMLGVALKGSPEARFHTRLALGYGHRALVESRRAGREWWQDARASRRPARGCYSAAWGASTLYCSLGMDFAHNDLRYLQSRREELGFQVALMVYDLIPAVAPQYTTIDLTAYFIDLLRVCDLALVISDFTADDLKAFARDHAVAMPVYRKVPLGSALLDIAPERPAMLPVGVGSGRYALCVGTVTLRKNHHLLLDVWQIMAAEYGATNIPHLVIAGARGSISAETLSRLDRDATLRAHVHYLDCATDEEVAWLYANCSFTVYPSLYEGWGLPVTESHDFGKVCLASDRTSLPEAGAGLALHLDPLDRQAWKAAIMQLWGDDNDARTNLEQTIAHRHHRRADAAQVLLQALASVRTSPNLKSQHEDATPGVALS